MIDERTPLELLAAGVIPGHPRLMRVGERIECRACQEVILWCQCEPSPFFRRVLACGGRYYDNYKTFWWFLDTEHAISPIICLIDGECYLGGADLIAHEWAVDRGVPTERYPMRKGEGSRRNGRMLVAGRPDAVVAAPGGSGTADMCRRAQAAGVPVIYV